MKPRRPQTLGDKFEEEFQPLEEWLDEDFYGPAERRAAVERETATWLTWDHLFEVEHLYDFYRNCRKVGWEVTSQAEAQELWDRILGPRVRIIVGPDSCNDDKELLTEVAYRLTYDACHAALMEAVRDRRM